MTRVALISNGISSTVHSSLELARRLEERGHPVTFISHADIGETVESNGFSFIRLSADRAASDEIRRRLEQVGVGGIGARLVAARRLLEAAWRGRRSTADARELVGVLRRLDPDLLLIDIEAHVAIIGSSQLGIPTALTTFLFAIEQRPGVPPIDSWHRPNETAALRADWTRVRSDSRRATRRRRWSRRGLIDLFGPVSYGTTSRDALRSVARRTGFDLNARTDTSQWLRPHGYTGVPVLTTNVRELEFGDGASPDWHYVGPMVHTARHDAAASGTDDWRALLHRRRQRSHRPLVYCSLGSYWTADVGLLRRVVDAAARRPDWDLVIGLGGRGAPDALGALPENVLAIRWAPQVEVLAEADAAIVHGGNASLNECIAFGVPMLVCSTGHLDQNGIATRVEDAGIGLSHLGQTVESSTIEADLHRLLTEPRFSDEISELRELATSPPRSAHAVDLLEALAGER